MNRLPLLILLLLLAALLYHCLAVRPPQIEADVLACAETRLAEDGLDDIQISIDGRDLLLAGSVTDEDTKRRAGVAVSNNCGARVVTNELAVVAPVPYRTKLCIDSDGLEIDGTLPDAAAENRYRSIAADRLGAVRVRTEVTIRGDIPVGYDRMMTTAFTELSQIDKGCIELVDDEVGVSGEVRSAEARDRIVGDMNLAAGSDFQVSYDLTVPELSESAQACQQALDTLLSPGEQVLFDFDSSEIHAAGRQLLNEAEAIWERCPDISLIVAGHTDSEGDAEYNRALSDRRAVAVVDFLVQQGFDPERLTPVGYGEAQPQASNETEEGRALNRRMEFRVRETVQ